MPPSPFLVYFSNFLIRLSLLLQAAWNEWNGRASHRMKTNIFRTKLIKFNGNNNNYILFLQDFLHFFYLLRNIRDCRYFVVFMMVTMMMTIADVDHQDDVAWVCLFEG